MKPYYETALGKLYCGDCLEILPGIESVDAVITDPVWPNCPADLLPGAENPWELFQSAWEIMPRAARAVIVMRHDSDPRFLAPVPLPYTRAVWLPYVMPGYIGRMLGGDEIGYCFGEPIPSRVGQRVIPGRATPAQPNKRRHNGHPCSRVLEHFLFIVRWWSEPDEIVLDPFAGSGTTALACEHLGRRWIGIEISEKYCEIAAKRIEKEAAQLKLGLT